MAFFIIVFLGLQQARAGEYIPTPVDGVEMSCFKESTPMPWAFCINRYRGSANKSLLIYLHARNGNETWWNDKTYHTGRLYEEWRAQSIDPPVVVSLSFGKLWLLTENKSDDHGGLHKILHDHVIPRVEEELGEKRPKKMIAGISMGGLNTLIEALKGTAVYSKAVALCPPLAAVSPHESLFSILSYYLKSSTSLKRAFMLWKFSKEFYPTNEIWELNDPLFRAKTYSASENSPEFYLSCGEKDPWGCMKGSEILVDRLLKGGAQVQWMPRKGGHCDIDYPSLAEFLH